MHHLSIYTWNIEILLMGTIARCVAGQPNTATVRIVDKECCVDNSYESDESECFHFIASNMKRVRRSKDNCWSTH